MRLENLKIKLSLAILFGHPDKNGVIYSKEAVEKAVAGFERQLPSIGEATYNMKGQCL